MLQAVLLQALVTVTVYIVCRPVTYQLRCFEGPYRNRNRNP